MALYGQLRPAVPIFQTGVIFHNTLALESVIHALVVALVDHLYLGITHVATVLELLQRILQRLAQTCASAGQRKATRHQDKISSL
jgi:hypothetical protein